MKLAIIGFALMLVLMYVLIKEKLAPPVAFIVLPLIAAFAAGCGMEAIAGFIEEGMATMLSTAVLFIFSISYFTLMCNCKCITGKPGTTYALDYGNFCSSTYDDFRNRRILLCFITNYYWCCRTVWRSG